MNGKIYETDILLYFSFTDNPLETELFFPYTVTSEYSRDEYVCYEMSREDYRNGKRARVHGTKQALMSFGEIKSLRFWYCDG